MGTLLSICFGSVICFWLITYILARKIEKLEQKVRDNKELIKDLYRIDDERLLNEKDN